MMRAGADASRRLSERVRAALALFVVFAGGWLFGHFWLFRSVDDAQRLGAALSGFVGLVMGHYFGHLGVDRAEETATRAHAHAAALQALAAKLAVEDRGIQETLAAMAAQADEYQVLLDMASADPAIGERFNAILKSIQERHGLDRP